MDLRVVLLKFGALLKKMWITDFKFPDFQVCLEIQTFTEKERKVVQGGSTVHLRTDDVT